MLTFQLVSSVAASICIVLAAVWLFRPETILSIWNIGNSEETSLVARRGGALFTGLAILLFLGRNSEDPVSRYAIAVGIAVCCSVLAILGCYEWLCGRAGVGILLAVAVEAVLAIGFGWVRHGKVF